MPETAWELLKSQVFLGDEKFVNKIQELINSDKNLDEVPSGQKIKLPKPIIKNVEESKFKT
ncbi:MAG: hypothetical protein COA42_18975 [Alteromonadaceae bacterium]|nr:MAG: hypothetical protein COA42_18975 [Alteromonadaceae bacterium]